MGFLVGNLVGFFVVGAAVVGFRVGDLVGAKVDTSGVKVSAVGIVHHRISTITWTPREAQKRAVFILIYFHGGKYGRGTPVVL